MKYLAKLILFGIFLSIVSSCGSSGSSGSDDSNDAGKTVDTGDNILGFDPLYSQQWYLRNSGQKAFSLNSGNPNMDINPISIYREGIFGEGIQVAVVDTGLEIEHEDLKENIVLGRSWNFIRKNTDPTNTYQPDHGTAVAGLIGAVAGNGKGGKGVAPKVKLRGYNMLNPGLLNQDAAQVKSLGSPNPEFDSSDVDIFNLSYGMDNTNVIHIAPEVEAQYEYGVNSLRGGKGTLYVKAAGNGFNKITRIDTCERARRLGISCQNSNMNPAAALPWTLIVGAYNATGKKSSYSTTGSSLWVSGPGGEYGNRYPAMVTTDQTGCDRGYSRYGSSGNDFEGNFNGLNQNCNYTSRFNGTSSATPVVSGTIALMLEANPDLHWRQVFDILAKTSTRRDAGFKPITIELADGTYIVENSWITNKAGYHFHNWYGFGEINVQAAVKLAQKITGSPKTLKDTGWKVNSDMDLEIPTNSKEGITGTQNITENLSIFTVLLEVTVIDHTSLRNLAIELVSPAGTKSILLNTGSGFDTRAYLGGMKLRTNAFYGESSAGEWKIKLVDAGKSSAGKLKEWKIKVLGTDF